MHDAQQTLKNWLLKIPTAANEFSKSNKRTVWKVQDFSITQILREIDFGECQSFETINFWALNFVIVGNFSLPKVQKFIKFKFRPCKCVEMADIALQINPKLISRKI